MSTDGFYERLYDRLFESCVTANQLAQVHILLENRLTPREAFDLSSHIVATYSEGPVRRRITWLRIERDRRRQAPISVGAPRAAPRYLRALHAAQWAHLTRVRFDMAGGAVAPTTRQFVRGGVTLYRNRVTDGPVTLILVFTGNLRGVMMPTSLFLQVLADRDVDVLKVEAPRGSGYVVGVAGLGADFAQSLDGIAALAAAEGYSDLVTLGTSGGGLPALLAASPLGARAALVVGPGAAHGDTLSAQLGAVSLDDMLAGYPEQLTVTLVYGARSTRDRDTVMGLAGQLPTSAIHEIPDAGHACLYELLERGQASSFLGAALFPPASTPRSG